MTDQDLTIAANSLGGYVREHLPEGWEIEISLRSDEQSARLLDPGLNEIEDHDLIGDEAIIVGMCKRATEIQDAIDAADREAEAKKPGYMIECLEHRTGSNRLWWRPNSAGYTSDIDAAGRYTLADATRIVGDGKDQKMWPIEDVIMTAKRVLFK